MKLLKPAIVIISILLLLIAYLINSDCFADYMLPPLPVIDLNKIWNLENIDKVEVTKIIIKVPDSFLTTLTNKISTRTPAYSIPKINFKYGFNNEYLETVVQYWTKEYSWQKWEDKLNMFPHYFTHINGLQLHFIHIQPILKEGQRSVPILLLHGWPGSFFEFYKVIPMLIERPETEDIVYEVICPSLPGFGWSESAKKPGLGISAISSIMFDLMDRLNVTDKFYIQGGDFGSLIASTMSKMNPSKVAGIHVNMIEAAVFDHRYWFKLAVGAYLPKTFHFLSEEDQDIVYPYNKKMKDMIDSMGYFWLHATRPSTIGIALSDSPVGLAAYILEKFGAFSNDLDYHLNSPNGGIEDLSISIDEMLTNVMIYYITNTISSSVTIYKEMWNEEDQILYRHPVRIPTGIAFFPKELAKVPREFAEFGYRDIRQYTRMPRGGHFAALEEPALLAEDIMSFVDIVEKSRRT